MEKSNCPPGSKPVIVSILVLILTIPGINLPGEGSPYESRAPTRREYSSLSGTYNVTEVDTSHFIGKEFYRNIGKLGSTSLFRDLNGDQFMDIVISAPGAPGSGDYQRGGKTFIFFGREDLLPEKIDLEEMDPDVKIHGGFDDAHLLTEIKSGDFDGDGILDWAIGNPSEPTAGKMYILWGDYWWPNGTFPEEIELISPGKDYPGNGNPLGFYRSDKWTIASGPIGTSVYANYQVAYNLISEDMDGDGTDDLLVTLHGWDRFTILWGTDSKWTFGGPKTTTIDMRGGSFLGGSVDMGDIDGDGKLDLVVGAPVKKNEPLNKIRAGAVFVYYDIAGKSGGNASIGARPMIYGDDAYDFFGSKVMLEDLDGDGKDDIIVAATGTDGPDEKRKEAGSIYVFRGKSADRFPLMFSAGNHSNLIVHGLKGSEGDIPGDRLGNSFGVGDIDFDGDKDLVVGLYHRSTGERAWVGSMVGYHGEDIFEKSGTLDLRDVEPAFWFWGIDQEDSLGSSISLGDFNHDGADDILVGAPGADGEENLRPRCGEVYMMLGSAVNVRRLEIGGAAVENREVFAGSGHLSLNISYVNTFGASDLDRLTLSLDPRGENISVRFTEEGAAISNVRYGTPDLLEESAHGANEINGWFDIRLDIGWFVPLGKDVTVRVSLETLSGDIVYRDFPSAFTVVRDVELRGNPEFMRNGREMINTREWIHPGDNLTFSNISMIYSAKHHREIPHDVMKLRLVREDSGIAETTYSGKDWSMWDTVPESEEVNYTILPVSGLGDPPGGLPEDYIPEMLDGMGFNFRIDLNTPPPPENLVLKPDGEVGKYDDDLEWTASWEDPSDKNGSGIRHYLVETGGSDQFIPRSTGGLRGTYYANSDFTSPVFERNDYRIDFDWGPFGPEHEDYIGQDFSVRWNGWISMDGYPTERLRFSGAGQVKVFVHGEMVLDWADISDGPLTEDLDISGFVPFEAYYRPTGAISGIIMNYAEGTGRSFPVDSDHLMHPSNSTEVELQGEGLFEVLVRSVDWTGQISKPAAVSGIVDRTAPHMDLSGIPSWTRSLRPELEVPVEDPDIDGEPGSGIGGESFRYRVISEEGYDLIDWTRKNLTYSEGVFTLFPRLKKGFRGFLEIEVNDSVGNTRESTSLMLNVDRKMPEIILMGPDIGSPIKKESVTLFLEARDLGGSGVDGDSIKYRMGRENLSDWTETDDIESGETVPFEIELDPGYGRFMIVFSVSDIVGNTNESEIFDFTLEEDMIDEVPVPVIASPTNGSSYNEGVLIRLDATGSSDDGEVNPDHLRYSWISDMEGVIGTGRTIDVRLQRGEHIITLWVSDGTPGHNASVSVIVSVVRPEIPEPPETEEDEEEKSTLWIWVAVTLTAILLLASFLVILMSYMKRSGEETRMEMRSISEDDLEYSESSE